PLAGGDQAVDHRPDALQAGVGGGVELDPRPVAGHAYHVAAGKRGTVQAQAHGVNFTSRRLGDRMSPKLVGPRADPHSSRRMAPTLARFFATLAGLGVALTACSLPSSMPALPSGTAEPQASASDSVIRLPNTHIHPGVTK